MTMIELTFRFESGDVSQEIIVALFDIKQVRDADSPAPWDVRVTITWGAEVAFDRPLAGADPFRTPYSLLLSSPPDISTAGRRMRGACWCPR